MFTYHEKVVKVRGVLLKAILSAGVLLINDGAQLQ